MAVKIIAIHGPLNHRVKFLNACPETYFFKNCRQQSNYNQRNNISWKRIDINKSASCAARESSIALNFVAHDSGYRNNFIQFCNAPDKGKVRIRIANNKQNLPVVNIGIKSYKF